MDTLAKIGLFIGGAVAVIGTFYGLFWVFDTYLIPLVLRRLTAPVNLKAIAEERVSRSTPSPERYTH